MAHCRATEAHFNGEAGEGLPELEVEKKKLRPRSESNWHLRLGTVRFQATQAPPPNPNPATTTQLVLRALRTSDPK